MQSCSFTGEITDMKNLQKSSGGKDYIKFSMKCKNLFGNSYQYINCVAWGEKALDASCCTVGDIVSINSEYRTSKYDASDGTKKVMHEFNIRDIEYFEERGRVQEPVKQKKEAPKLDKLDPFDDDDLPF